MTAGANAIVLPYGDATVRATAPGRCLGSLEIDARPGLTDPATAIRESFARPIGMGENVFEGLTTGLPIVILVSDSFRQTRADTVLPVLLDGLSEAGIEDSDISVLFSTGTHRGPTHEEQRLILGPETFDRLSGRIASHDAHDPTACVFVGTTRRGTPVEINRLVVEAGHVIATGGVVLHYFAGFGGGRKSVVPGVASARTIAHNHAMNLHASEDTLDPAVRIGALDGNPVAEDMLEASRMCRVDFIVNTVLNRDGAIAGVFAGELEAAHAEACAFAQDTYAVEIAERADVVIAASAQTKNFVQTHKALFNAYQAVKPEGRIVLAAPCAEGLGGEQFAQWLRLGDRSAIIAALRRQSEINGQTALSTREKAPRTLLVSEMDEADVALLGGRKSNTLQDAIDRAFAEAGGGAESTYYCMPSAAYTVPFSAA